VGELLREIIAEALADIDDDRIEWVSVTGVDVDEDLNRAVVYYDTLEGGADPAGDAIVAEALDDHRGRVRGVVGREARVRRVPEIVFRPDPGIRLGERIDGLLRPGGDDMPDDPDDVVDRDRGTADPA
jgi:ribosome-binding factor A